MNKKIFVTQPSLPPLSKFTKLLEQIWENKHITNDGPFHSEFETKLADYLGVNHISLFSNGTLALITALRALQITGEVITTPYSFIATTHSLWWNGIKPIFVDIEPNFMNLDPKRIEAAITENTTAILPVHVYGNPCKMDEIETIAQKHKLKVIYDAAHAFGVQQNNQSVLKHGDLSILSFHATKVFNTIEGGAIISHSADMKHHIDNLKNFGYRTEILVEEPGINAKMNELQAAYGCLQLELIDECIKSRKEITNYYRTELANIKGITLLNDIEGTTHVYSYMPILITEEEYGISRDALYNLLKEHNIFSRRYFYPLISHFEPYSKIPSANISNLPIAENITQRILCLPIYPEIQKEELDSIISIIKIKR